jgi:hypothetical protein
MVHKDADVFGFVRAFTADWFEAMSGSASVPFALAAVFVSDALEKALLAAVSAFCIILASYLIWKKERVSNNLLALEYEELLKKSKPRLSIHFDEHDEFIGNYHPDRKPWLMIPVSIINDGGIFLDECRVRVRYDPPGFPRRSDGVLFGDQLSCRPFSLLPDDGKLVEILAFDDPRFQPCENYLNIVTFTEQADGWTEQGSAKPILLPGTHQITVEAFSANTRRSFMDLILTYEGDTWRAKKAI